MINELIYALIKNMTYDKYMINELINEGEIEHLF